MPPWLFVCPASRGLGLEVARHLLRTTKLPLVATARNDLDKTRSLILGGAGKDVNEDRLHVLRLDVCDETTIADAAAECSKLFPHSNPKDASPSHLHLAFALPGILHPEKSPSQLDAEKMMHTFQVNTIGNLLLLKHFSAFLPKKSANLSGDGEDAGSMGALPHHATWATLSARVGSISDNTLGGWYSYRASKAAVNQSMKTFDNYLKTSAGDNAIGISLHPGTVKTGLSKQFWGNVKEGKLFDADFAAERLVDVVCRLDVQKGRGRCWDWAGKEIPP